MANDPIQEAYEEVYRDVNDGLAEAANGPSTVNVAPPKNKKTPQDITPKVQDAEDGEQDDDADGGEVKGVNLVKNKAPSVTESEKKNKKKGVKEDAI